MVWVTGASALATFLAGGAVSLIRSTSPALAATADDVRSEADWVLSAQRSDGAIANYVDKLAVWPYLSHFAAMGLARAKEVTGDKKYTDAAWRWLNWYQSKQDATGFVTDYVVKNGVLTSTRDMDSTDSYAGMFLLAVQSAYRASSDKGALNKLKSGIARAVKAIEATQQGDGLTWAKPAWHVKYLMDQAETYAGLRAGASLANVVGDSALAQRATGDADRMKAGVDRLWNAGTASYDWAVHEDGARVPSNGSILYSDALQQVWAVTFGMTDQARATDLMTRFNAAQPSWALPAATALFSGGTQTAGYWPEASFGYAELASPIAPTSVASIRSASITAQRAWPYTTAIAGQLILAEAYAPTISLLGTVVVTAPQLSSALQTSPLAGQAAPRPVATRAMPTGAGQAAVAAPSAPAPAPASPSGAGALTAGVNLGPVGVRASVGRQGIGAGVTLGSQPLVGLGIGTEPPR
jgi:hypothetical protein